ncbi:MAG TPA: hypothetical protein VK929_04015 [Longimicrobiales bacterium]|nr:hypothetical protein [Longimicrobiales bacterium]
MYIVTILLGLALGGLALTASLVFRARLNRVVGSRETALSDEMVRQIEESGWVEVDEPLDYEEIQEEEARFWEEPWEEPDEW